MTAIAATTLAAISAGIVAGIGGTAVAGQRNGGGASPAAISTSLVTTSAPALPAITTAGHPESTSVPAIGATATASHPTTSAPAGHTTTTVTHSTTSTSAAAPTAGSVLFGAVTDDLTQLNTFQADSGKSVSLYESYASFAFDSDFDAAAANTVRRRGAQPIVTWEPWDPTSGSANQPAYALSKITAGSYDAYITRWATEIKASGQPLWLRFAHEMNGDWYPWAEGVNGNAPGSYVAAWRHVHNIFQAIGATNVTWVWTPNVIMGATPTLASLYPGDAYVSWVGVDGYNWGATASWSTWQTPDQVFGPTLSTVRQISGRPIVIAEVATTEVGGNKAQWIQQFFSMLSRNTDIRAFVWFNLNKETDWRIESSGAATAAFATGVSATRYR